VDAFQSLLHEALIVTAVLTLPVLGLATLVGLAVAIVQAATQVQEQTLSLLPKIVVVAGWWRLAARSACGCVRR